MVPGSDTRVMDALCLARPFPIVEDPFEIVPFDVGVEYPFSLFIPLEWPALSKVTQDGPASGTKSYEEDKLE